MKTYKLYVRNSSPRKGRWHFIGCWYGDAPAWDERFFKKDKKGNGRYTRHTITC